MSKVFVVDTSKKPLDPIHPGRARLLLKQGKAAVWRRFPFTLILQTRAVRTQGYFNITNRAATVEGISYKACSLIHHCDGYSYQKGERDSSHA